MGLHIPPSQLVDEIARILCAKDGPIAHGRDSVIIDQVQTGLSVLLEDFAAPAQEGGELAQLRPTYSCLQVGHLEIETRLAVAAAVEFTVVAGGFGDGSVRRHKHPALPA
jgi:hypothetical protein